MDCLARNTWICGEYLRTRQHEILAALAQHVELTVVSVLIGLLVSLPLALLARRFRRTRPAVLGSATALYTIPSLAMFSLLLPATGLTATTVVIGLVLYSLTILVRNILVGLDGVPAEVRDAARGLGYGPARTLLRVELPLAVPAVIAGLRIATVSTIALTTIGAIVGYGGLGNLIYAGLPSLFRAQVLAASVLCVLLALVADGALLGLQRLLTPWQRGAR
jgi:osmoprotectant transport system permease protein